MEAILNAPPAEEIMGKVLTCLAEKLRVEIRLPSNFLQHDYQRGMLAVTPPWLSSTWEFLHTGKVKVHDLLPHLPLKRVQ